MKSLIKWSGIYNKQYWQYSDLPHGGYWIPYEKSKANSDVIVPKSSAVNTDDQM